MKINFVIPLHTVLVTMVEQMSVFSKTKESLMVITPDHTIDARPHMSMIAQVTTNLSEVTFSPYTFFTCYGIYWILNETQSPNFEILLQNVFGNSKQFRTTNTQQFRNWQKYQICIFAEIIAKIIGHALSLFLMRQVKNVF